MTSSSKNKTKFFFSVSRQRYKIWSLSGLAIIISLVGLIGCWLNPLIGYPLRPGLDFTGGTQIRLERKCIGQCEPVSTSEISKIFSLSEVAIATSGDYQNFFEHQNIRYSHIIDPITGFPVQRDLVSATVISNNAMIADAFATALILLGSESAIALANQRNLAVYLIKKDGEKYTELMSSNLLNYL